MSTYQKIVSKIGTMLPPKLQNLWLHPAGPTTIFFWAPAFKWGLVFAGLHDMNRPPETISVLQTASLTATGAIWTSVYLHCIWRIVTSLHESNIILVDLYNSKTSIRRNFYYSKTLALHLRFELPRYSLVIIPKNWMLFSVNLFTCTTNMYNFARGTLYEMGSHRQKK